MRCSRLFQRRSISHVRCDMCTQLPTHCSTSEQPTASEPVSDHDSDSCADAPMYADVDPIDRSEGAYLSGGLVFRDEAEREAFLD